MNRKEVAAATGLKYTWLHEVQSGHIKDPGSQKIDRLRAYLLSEEVKATRQ